MDSPQHHGPVPDDSGDTALSASIRTILAQECLSPEEILARLQVDSPDLTLDRVLITLYQNAAIFRRQHGMWCTGTTRPPMSRPVPRMVS